MARAADKFSGQVKQRSGWLIPLAVFFVTACLSALVFAYYFVPGPLRLGQELTSPTDSTRRVAVTLGDTHLQIPSNYLPFARAQKGGAMDEIALAASLPNFEGYSLALADEFESNAPNSRIVFISLKSETIAKPEQERLERIYLNQVEDRYGEDGPFGLRHYAFRPDSGYHNDDLLVGQDDEGPVVFLCNKPEEITPSPNCMRDLPLNSTLGLSYRFKRTQLARWKAIDRGVRTLIAGFAAKN